MLILSKFTVTTCAALVLRCAVSCTRTCEPLVLARVRLKVLCWTSFLLLLDCRSANSSRGSDSGGPLAPAVERKSHSRHGVRTPGRDSVGRWQNVLIGTLAAVA